MKYFIFDMDGVLIDSEPIHQKILQQVCQSININLKKEYYETLTGMAAIPLWTKIKNDFQRNETVEELSDYHKDFFYKKLPSLHIKEVPGVKEVIQKLKENGYCLSIASSSSKKMIEHFTKQIGIYEHFEFIVSGEELKQSKPFPDIFLKVADFYNAPSEQFWVMEDSQHGVTAAKSAGMKCIGFQNPSSGKQDLSQADIIITKMADFTDDFIQKIIL